MMASFDLFIGIDYSGAETPTSRLKSIQVYASDTDEPRCVMSPSATEGKRWNWTRQEVAQWLIEQARSGKRFTAGIDQMSSLAHSNSSGTPPITEALLLDRPTSSVPGRDRFRTRKLAFSFFLQSRQA